MPLSISDRLKTSIITKVSLLSYDSTLKPFFKKNLKAYKLLLTVFRVSLRKTYSIS